MIQVHVGNQRFAFLDADIDKCGTARLGMKTGGREERIASNGGTRPDKRCRQESLGEPPTGHTEHVRITVDLAKSLLGRLNGIAGRSPFLRRQLSPAIRE